MQTLAPVSVHYVDYFRQTLVSKMEMEHICKKKYKTLLRNLPCIP